MKRKILQTVSKPLSFRMIVLAFFLVFLFACNKKDTSPILSKTSDKEALMTLAEAAKINEAKQRLAKFSKDYIKMPLAVEEHGTKRSSSRKGLTSNEDINFNKALVTKAINSDDYECGPTALDYYINNSVSDWDDNDFDAFFSFSDLIWNYYYALDNSDGADDYFGIKGEYTNTTTRTFRDLKRFWNIHTDIVIYAAHGNFFSDKSKVLATLIAYRDLFGIIPGSVTDDQLSALADDIKTVFGTAHFWNYKHPLLSLNAFAAGAEPYFGIIKKVVMGDGIQDAYVAMGYGDVATQAILAHEYGHHVQFDKGVDFGNSAEGTRRTELMADAFSAYFLTHKQGAAMNWKRVKEFLQVFYAIGDCQFDNPGHHGTPYQRMASAQFGYDVANDTKKKGKVMTAEDFITAFDAQLSTILAPDAH